MSDALAPREGVGRPVVRGPSERAPLRSAQNRASASMYHWPSSAFFIYMSAGSSAS